MSLGEKVINKQLASWLYAQHFEIILETTL